MSLACDICRADWKWPEARVCRRRRRGLSTGDRGCRLSLGGGALSAAAAAAWVSRCPATVLSAAVDTGGAFLSACMTGKCSVDVCGSLRAAGWLRGGVGVGVMAVALAKEGLVVP